MNEQVFRYCERGLDPSFWAEPLNAVSNAAFFAAALAALWDWRDRPPGERSNAVLFLILTVFVIGAGSFLFHTFATVWSGLADVIPIGVFMLGYLIFALVRFARAGAIGTLLGLAAFAGALILAGQIRCHGGRVGFLSDIPPGDAALCLNGSGQYLPALLAMALLGLWLRMRRHPAGVYVLGAAATFLVSVSFRSLDFTLCQTTTVAGKSLGVHFLWHLLNAATLYLLLFAASRHGRPWPVAPAAASLARQNGPGPRGRRIAGLSRGKAKPEILPPRPGDWR